MLDISNMNIVELKKLNEKTSKEIKKREELSLEQIRDFLLKTKLVKFDISDDKNCPACKITKGRMRDFTNFRDNSKYKRVDERYGKFTNDCFAVKNLAVINTNVLLASVQMLMDERIDVDDVVNFAAARSGK